LEVEPYGFDEEVIVIVQPHKEFNDYNKNDPDSVTKIYKANWGRKFIFPAEYDILLYFIPVANSEKSFFKTSAEGKFRMRTRYQ